MKRVILLTLILICCNRIFSQFIPFNELNFIVNLNNTDTLKNKLSKYGYELSRIHKHNSRQIPTVYEFYNINNSEVNSFNYIEVYYKNDKKDFRILFYTSDKRYKDSLIRILEEKQYTHTKISFQEFWGNNYFGKYVRFKEPKETSFSIKNKNFEVFYFNEGKVMNVNIPLADSNKIYATFWDSFKKQIDSRPRIYYRIFIKYNMDEN